MTEERETEEAEHVQKHAREQDNFGIAFFECYAAQSRANRLPKVDHTSKRAVPGCVKS